MKNPIIPISDVYYQDPVSKELDVEAICIFTALGFFLGSDTYWRNQKVLPPAHEYAVDAKGNVKPGEKVFEWYHEPRQVTFDQVVDEFAHLFETITQEQVQGKDVILPLSGGLDSRSQATALKSIGYSKVISYSYGFEDSFNETLFGKKIAERCGYEFHDLTIPKGYLWKVIDELADINKCHSDFTHPRQMAVLGDLAPLGNLFYLGHWGDVLFDDMRIAGNASEDEQLVFLKKKLLKKGGIELADQLWKAWGRPGKFESYLDDRLKELYSEIKIDNANARIRAFKSMYWAPRWTSVNLLFFSAIHPVALPYYDDRMCRFICTVPEEYLSGRKIQIEYIKRKTPNLAAISWQPYDPCNLYNYHAYGSVKNLPYRVLRKTGQVWREKVLGKRIVTRNWENQFLGHSNQQNMEDYLFNNLPFNKWLPPQVAKNIYDGFRTKDELYYSHPLSMLLTLSQFAKMNL